MSDFKLLINGQLVDGDSTMDVINPATEQPVAQCARASKGQLDQAVAAAKAAFPAWAAMPVAERSAILLKVAEGVEARIEELAQVETRDNGSLLRSHRRGVMPRVAMNIRFFAEYAVKELSHPDFDTRGHRNHVSWDPAGVTAIVTPWNAPLMLATWRIGPALAAGNTVVAKPPEWAPLTASLFADIAHEAGLPAGVFHYLSGSGREIGEALVEKLTGEEALDELLEAERAKDELRDIMSRLISAEIRYTQMGYWMRRAPYISCALLVLLAGFMAWQGWVGLHGHGHES